MSCQDQQAVFDNPFSTRRIRPGSVPYIFPSGESVDTLIERLRHSDWWGEVIGRHGSGKSTLIATLAAAIEHAGRPTVLITLHDRQRRLPQDFRGDERLHAPAVAIIDGYEQLSHWSRLTLKQFCRRRAIGLVVTAHESVGLPTIFCTAVTTEIAQQVVGELMRGCEATIEPDEVPELLARHNGDLRETLFGLYDLYEVRRAATAARERIKEKG